MINFSLLADYFGGSNKISAKRFPMHVNGRENSTQKFVLHLWQYNLSFLVNIILNYEGATYFPGIDSFNCDAISKVVKGGWWNVALLVLDYMIWNPFVP